MPHIAFLPRFSAIFILKMRMKFLNLLKLFNNLAYSISRDIKLFISIHTHNLQKFKTKMQLVYMSKLTCK